MLATAKSYDVICLQMMIFFPHLENDIRNDLQALMLKIKALALSTDVKSDIDTIIPHIFDFRIKAIKWLVGNQKFDLKNVFDEVYPQFEHLRQNPKFEVLAENILFALRCNKKVVDVMLNDISIEAVNADISTMPETTYKDLISVVVFNMPDEYAQSFLDWVNSSLYIETVLIATAIIQEENLEISDQSVNNLAYTIANAAQEYIAISTLFGLLPHRSGTESGFNRNFIDEVSLKEEQGLADLGLDDFAKNYN